VSELLYTTGVVVLPLNEKWVMKQTTTVSSIPTVTRTRNSRRCVCTVPPVLRMPLGELANAPADAVTIVRTASRQTAGPLAGAYRAP